MAYKLTHSGMFGPPPPPIIEFLDLYSLQSALE